MSYRRRGADFDDDEEIEAKRRRGPPEHTEVVRKLQDIIARLGEKSAASSLESNLESLCTVLEADLDKYRSTIIDIIAVCITAMPEKLTIYSTLVGLLNAKNFNFGGEVVEKLVSDLQDKLDNEHYQHALFIILFLCDLGNCKVLTLNSIAEFLESLIQAAYEESVPQVRTDWFIFVVLHALPWIGSELNEHKKEELANIMEGCGKYIEDRQKPYVSLCQVWTKSTPHEQDEYLDAIWAQINNLKGANWSEKHIRRHHVAFDAALQDALQHNLPSFTPPIHKETSTYPLPYVVFRLFDYADCIDDGTGVVLPGSHAIERFLIEEELTWILEHHYFDRKACAEELLNYGKGANVPIAYMILETIFAHMFRLPKNPQPIVFYGSLLFELCRFQPDVFPPVLAQAAELLYQRCDGMQPICVDRFIDWFSFHLSNFQYKWTWNDWKDCLEGETWNGKFVFAREVLEKCMRLSYYEHLVEVVPDDFHRILPARPDIRFFMDDETDPNHQMASNLMSLFNQKATDDVVMSELKNSNGEFDPNSFGVFVSVILKMATKSISHLLTAITRYHKTLREVADVSEEMQNVVLQAIYGCWKTNHQMIIILVDKLLKMQVLDCGVVVAWIFSEEMKSEMDRQWVYEILNTALDRLSRHLKKVTKDHDTIQKRVERQRNTTDGDGDEEMADDQNAKELDELQAVKEKFESLKEFQKNLFLDVLHKFTIVLTEHIVACESDGTDAQTPWFEWMTGRFKQVFLLHNDELRKYIDDLGKELFSESTVDTTILSMYHQFVSLSA